MIALAERLTEIMQELGLETPTQLASFCGVTQGLVTQWFDGSTKLGPKPLLAFARTDFSLDWIMEGKLPKYRNGIAPGTDATDQLTDALVELVLHYQATDERGRENIMSLARSVAKRSRTRWQRVPDDTDTLGDSP